jgi:CRISPR-associated protein Cas2
MQTYVIYDIVKDRVRKKIADACLDYGLRRIQYSAFLGNINATRRRSLQAKLTTELGTETGKIEIIAVCSKDFEKRCIIEEAGT